MTATNMAYSFTPARAAAWAMYFWVCWNALSNALAFDMSLISAKCAATASGVQSDGAKLIPSVSMILITANEPAPFMRFAKSPLRLLDAVKPSAYGIFLVHYIFIVWLQYAVYEPAWPAFVKLAIVFAGTLSMSWGLIVLLRKIPVVARMV